MAAEFESRLNCLSRVRSVCTFEEVCLCMRDVVYSMNEPTLVLKTYLKSSSKTGFLVTNRSLLCRCDSILSTVHTHDDTQHSIVYLYIWRACACVKSFSLLRVSPGHSRRRRRRRRFSCLWTEQRTGPSSLGQLTAKRPPVNKPRYSRRFKCTAVLVLPQRCVK